MTDRDIEWYFARALHDLMPAFPIVVQVRPPTPDEFLLREVRVIDGWTRVGQEAATFMYILELEAIPMMNTASFFEQVARQCYRGIKNQVQSLMAEELSQ